MPFFEQNPLEKLALQAGDADATLDLRGLDAAEAMDRVEQLISGGSDRSTWLICFDAADGDGRETLFLPLGRRLLEARRAGLLVRCLPVTDGTGYLIAFAD